MSIDRGPWMQTFTGRRWYPLDPRPEDVCIEDIAHHTSLICRWGGAVKRLYPVAQHSYIASFLVPEPLAFHTLMHDAREAYCGDMIDPMKRALRTMSNAYDVLEGRAALAVARRFGLRELTPAETAVVKHADNVCLMTERRDLLAATSFAFPGELEAIAPDEEEITPWLAASAEDLFLDRFRQLTAGGRR